MQKMTGIKPSTFLELSDLAAHVGETVSVRGTVHDVRRMSEFTFIILRKRGGVLQCVLPKDASALPPLKNADTVSVTGTLEKDDRAPGGFELHLTDAVILSEAAATLPLDIAKWKMGAHLDALLELRPVALRNLRERAIFKIQEGLARGFRDFLFSQGFTEIRTPKIVAAGAEGGANIFKLDYFGKKAFLAQSPQFYKQAMVPVYERVFEVAPVYRAEKHSTSRHLNEYTSMDFEMGFIDSFYDVMEMETAMLQYTFDLLRREYAKELSVLKVSLPDVSSIPVVRFDEAKEMAAEAYGRPIRDPYDLDPEEEVNIGRLFQEKYNSDLVFVTHYPSKKRPFYAMDDPENPKYTLSFDLLLRGMEITTGGQRIHDYNMQIQKMLARGMHPEEFESYLMSHKAGMPPHGGLGIGLERLTMKLLGMDNIRYCCLFPRDLKRLEP